jgi:hypothetical protein
MESDLHKIGNLTIFLPRPWLFKFITVTMWEVELVINNSRPIQAQRSGDPISLDKNWAWWYMPSSYGRKYKIAGLQFRLAWAKSHTLSPK